MTRYAHSNLSISDLATLSGRSISSFNRDFKKHYQTTPKLWPTQKRLAFAHQLLVDTDKSITEVASSLGYDNLSHFSKAFKNQYQYTPNKIKIDC